MIFNILDVMKVLKYEFGDDAYIKIFNYDNDLLVRISNFTDKKTMVHFQYRISYDEINNCKFDIMGYKFKNAVKELMRKNG